MQDKSVQFTFTDDTALLSTMDALSRKKRAAQRQQRGESKHQEEEIDSTTAGTHSVSTGTSTSDFSSDTSQDVFATVAGTKLSAFLRRSANIFDALLKDDGESKSEGFSSSGGTAESKWVSLGAEGKQSSAAVGRRRTAMVRFSEMQSNLMVSAHPYSTSDADDEYPYKGLYCVWDIKNPSTPLFTLTASGQPTCATFSTTQSHLVLAGTEEGSLHLWDLRDEGGRSSGSKARPPSYSTLLDMSLLTKLQNSTSSGDDSQHMCAILHVASLNSRGSQSVEADRAATTSQFVSLDESGLVCFWATTNAETSGVEGTTHATKFGVSPWARVMLHQTRHLQVSSSPSAGLGILTSTSDKVTSHLGGAINGSGITRRTNPVSTSLFGSTQHNYVMSSIPSDVSTLLISTADGDVMKLARYGEAPSPAVLSRPFQSAMSLRAGSDREESKERDRGINDVSDAVFRTNFNDISFTSTVTCIAVREQPVSERKVVTPASDAHGGLVLVGRSDGTVDLFQLNFEAPLVSWSLSNLRTTAAIDSQGRKKGVTTFPSKQAVALRWYTHKDSVCFIVDAAGCLYIFDLSVSIAQPIFVEALLEKGEVAVHNVDISYSDPVMETSRRSTAGSIYITLYANKTLKTKKISDSILFSGRSSGVSNSSSNNEAELREALTAFSVQSEMSQLVSFSNV
eukprot:gene28299-35138_t